MLAVCKRRDVQLTGRTHGVAVKMRQWRRVAFGRFERYSRVSLSPATASRTIWRESHRGAARRQQTDIALRRSGKLVDNETI